MEAILCFSQAKHSHNQIIRGEILHFTQTKHSHNPWNIHGNVDRKAELNWYEYDSKKKNFFSKSEDERLVQSHGSNGTICFMEVVKTSERLF